MIPFLFGQLPCPVPVPGVHSAAGAWLIPSEHWGQQCPLAQMHSLALSKSIPNCHPASQGEIKSKKQLLSDQPPSLCHLKMLEDAHFQIICILSHQVLVLCCSTTLSSSPQGPDGIQAAETPGTWPWSGPRVTIHLTQRFIFGNYSVNSGKISSCAPISIPENSHWCFSFLPFPWDKALRAILLSLLVLFSYIMWQSVSRCLSSFLLSSCLFVTLSCLLVSLFSSFP